jgi:hypothetical protein
MSEIVRYNRMVSSLSQPHFITECFGVSWWHKNLNHSTENVEIDRSGCLIDCLGCFCEPNPALYSWPVCSYCMLIKRGGDSSIDTWWGLLHRSRYYQIDSVRWKQRHRYGIDEDVYNLVHILVANVSVSQLRVMRSHCLPALFLMYLYF